MHYIVLQCGLHCVAEKGRDPEERCRESDMARSHNHDRPNTFTLSCVNPAPLSSKTHSLEITGSFVMFSELHKGSFTIHKSTPSNEIVFTYIVINNDYFTEMDNVPNNSLLKAFFSSKNVLVRWGLVCESRSNVCLTDVFPPVHHQLVSVVPRCLFCNCLRLMWSLFDRRTQSWNICPQTATLCACAPVLSLALPVAHA